MHHFLITRSTLVLGIGLIAIGWFVRTFISKRRFDRRGIAGLQLFSSYWKWLLITRLESLFNFIAACAIVAGMIFILCAWYSHH